MRLTSPKIWGSLGTAALLLGMRRLLHRGLTPEPTLEGEQPEDYGLVAHKVSIPGIRGLKLFGWYIPAALPGPRPAIVLLHGWGGNASNLLHAAQAMHHAGHTVLLLESRNHGRSDQDGHSSLPSFADDLDCGLDWMVTQPGVDSNHLMALGHSIGGAAVLLSASRRHDLRAVVSISAFAHPEQVMRRWMATQHVPYWPLGWLANRYVELLIGARFEDIAPLNTLARARCPVLLLHGRQDTIVPVDDARKLWERRVEHITMIECDGTHIQFDDLDDVTRQILAFLEREIETGSQPAKIPIQESA